MGFYDLPKDQRDILVDEINKEIAGDILLGKKEYLLHFFSDEDTYIRKTSYLAIGKIYTANKKLQKPILGVLETLLRESDPKIRQTVVNAAGEIGKHDFAVVQH